MAIAQQTAPLQAQPLPTRTDRSLLMGDLSKLQSDGIYFWYETGKIAPIVELRFGPTKLYYVTDADYMRRILQSNNRNYIKEQQTMKVLEGGGEKVLFTTDGDEWMWRRRLMQPAFHRKQIAKFCDAIIDETSAMLGEWEDGKTVDVDEAMKHVTMMVIGKTMFNVDMREGSAELNHAYRTLGKYLINRIQQMIKPPLWLPVKENRDFHAIQGTIVDALGTIIEHRRTTQEPQNDLLDMLLAAKLEDTGQTFTDQQLIFEMSQIVFAGHETTATTLTWFFYLLADNPQVEARVLQEIDDVLGGRTPTMADLGNLTYLNQVLNETLRLFPPAYVTSRQSLEAEQFDGDMIPANARVLLNIYGVQRDPRYWDQPDAFIPERFSAENRKRHHKSAFLPFLIGPRKCIGEPLSRVEMQLMAATILQTYRLELPKNAKVTPEAGFVLQPKGSLNMILRTRNEESA